MSRPRPETVEREKDKLFLTDAELLRRLGVPEKIGRKMLRELSQDPTFPAKEAMAGNRRYWPAVSHWFDKRGHTRAKPDAIRELENRPVVIGSVYFLASETHIKIGFTTKAVPKRVYPIRQNHYQDLELMGVITSVPMYLEKSIHRKFAAFRLKGEWFKRVPEIEEFVKSHHLGHWRKELLLDRGPA